MSFFVFRAKICIEKDKGGIAVQNVSIKDRFRDWAGKAGRKRRQVYLQKKRSQLKNPNPTIIANNCIGGIVYHDLGLPFNSPTINLYMLAQDFGRFLHRLEEYLHCELIDVTEEDAQFPVGELRLDDETVRIHFMHYDTFADAKEKWVERCQRVDMNNIYVVYLNMRLTHPFRETYVMFRNLPYKNKVMLTRPVGIFDRKVVPFFSKRLSRYGKILEYPNLFSKKRYMDRCNFVKFLNQGYTEKKAP